MKRRFELRAGGPVDGMILPAQRTTGDFPTNSRFTEARRELRRAPKDRAPGPPLQSLSLASLPRLSSP
jgi:hypothetical protein